MDGIFSDQFIDGLVDRIAAKLAERLQTPQPPAGEPRYVREKELAERLGIKPSLLAKWRSQNYVRAATNVRPIVYSPDDAKAVEEFLLRSGRAKDVRQVEGGKS